MERANHEKTRLLCSLRFVSRVFFLDTCSLAPQIAKVIKLRTAHFAAANDVDVVDDRGMEREYSLNADAEAYLSNRDRFAGSAVFAGDHDAFKDLQAFLISFLNSYVHLDGVARLKGRDIFF